MVKVSDQRKEGVLGDEVNFRLGTDSSPLAQKDKSVGNDLRHNHRGLRMTTLVGIT